MSKFTATDAGDLVTIARRAPLSNMDEAHHVNDLLERFVEFFEDNIEGGVMPPGENENGPV